MTQLFTIFGFVALLASPTFAAPQSGELEAKLESAIAERFGLPAEAKIEVYGVRIGNQSSYEKAAAIKSLQIAGSGRLGSILTAKAILDGGDSNRVIWVRFRTSVEAPVVLTRRALERGSKIKASDVVLATRSITKNRPYYNVEDAIGRATRSPLNRGEILHIRNTKSSATMKRGEQVRVLIRRGAVSIRTTGEALEKGAIGDRIRVRIAPTGKTIAALVKAEGLVEVTL